MFSFVAGSERKTSNILNILIFWNLISFLRSNLQSIFIFNCSYLFIIYYKNLILVNTHKWVQRACIMVYATVYLKRIKKISYQMHFFFFGYLPFLKSKNRFMEKLYVNDIITIIFFLLPHIILIIKSTPAYVNTIA